MKNTGPKHSDVGTSFDSYVQYLERFESHPIELYDICLLKQN